VWRNAVGHIDWTVVAIFGPCSVPFSYLDTAGDPVCGTARTAAQKVLEPLLAELLPVVVAGLDHAVCVEDDGVAGSQGAGHVGDLGVGEHAERHSGGGVERLDLAVLPQHQRRGVATSGEDHLDTCG